MFIFLMGLISCQNEDVTRCSETVHVSICADRNEMDAETKTLYDVSSGSFLWNKGDCLGIFVGSKNINQKMLLNGSGGSKSGTFEGNLATDSTPNTLYVYYPYWDNEDLMSPNIKFDYSAQNFTRPSDFGKYQFFSGKAENVVLNTDARINAELESVMAYLKFVTNNPSKSKSIIVKSFRLFVDAESDSEPFIVKGSVQLASDCNIKNPTFAREVKITLGENGQGIELGPQESLTIPMVIVPTEINEDFYIQMAYSIDGESYRASMSRTARSFVKNKMIRYTFELTGAQFTTGDDESSENTSNGFSMSNEPTGNANEINITF